MSDHNGVCSYCGSPVDCGSRVCADCGANWRQVPNGSWLLVALFAIASWPILAIIVGLLTKSWFYFLMAGLAQVALPIVICVAWGAGRWVRESA